VSIRRDRHFSCFFFLLGGEISFFVFFVSSRFEIAGVWWSCVERVAVYVERLELGLVDGGDELRE
jgi:hypothetical protein